MSPHTRPQLASPSEILWSQAITHAQSLLQTHKIIFVRGKPGVGKSTFLQQVARDLGPEKSVWLDFRNETDLAYALQALCDQLGASFIPQTKNIQSELHELKTHFFSVASESQKIILVDNIHLIADAGSFLEEVLAHPARICLMAACKEMPAIDPMKIMDCGFVDLEGFDLEQTQEFLKRSQVKHDSTAAAAVAAKIHTETGGNPSLIKWMLAPLLFSRKELVLEEVSNLVSLAKKKYIENLLSALKPEERERIELASITIYSPSLESEILNELPKELQFTLNEAGLLQTKMNVVQIQPEAKAMILNRLNEDRTNQLSQQLLKEIKIERPNIPFDQVKERISLHLKLNRRQEAAALISHHMQDFELKGDTLDFIKLGDDCYEFFPLNIFMSRRFAVNIKKNLSQALFESKVYQERKIPRSHRQILQTFDAYSKCRLGQYAEVEAEVNALLSEDPDVPEVQVRALSILATTKLALGKAEEAKLIAKRIPQLDLRPFDYSDVFSGEICTESLSARAFALEGLGYFEEAMESYSRIENYSKVNAGKLTYVTDRLNSSNTMYRLGQAHRSLAHLKDSMKLVEELQSTTAKGWADYDYSLHLMNQGRLQESSDALQLPDAELHCHSHAKNVALKALQMFRTKPSLVRTFDWQRYALKIPPIDHQFFLFLTRLSTQESLQTFNLSTIEDFDNRTTLRISLLNIYLEACLKKGVRVDLKNLLGVLNDTPKQRLDFFLEVERKVLLGLHLLQNTKLDLAKRLLLEAKPMAESAEFYIWSARIHIGLAAIDFLEGKVEEAQRNIAASKHLAETHEFELEGQCAADLQAVLHSESRDFTSFEFKTPFIQSALANFYRSPVEKLKYIGPKGSLEILKSEANQYSESIALDLSHSTLKLGRKTIDLSQKHVIKAAFELFFKNPNRVFEKEEIISRVWLENYNPLHHDSRIYTLLKRMRDLLKSADIQSQIESQEKGFCFKPVEKFCILEDKDDLDELNPRQKWIVTYIRKNGEISRKTVESSLKISESSAGNELKSLVDQGLVKKSGTGKSTAYTQ